MKTPANRGIHQGRRSELNMVSKNRSPRVAGSGEKRLNGTEKRLSSTQKRSNGTEKRSNGTEKRLAGTPTSFDDSTRSQAKNNKKKRNSSTARGHPVRRTDSFCPETLSEISESVGNRGEGFSQGSTTTDEKSKGDVLDWTCKLERRAIRSVTRSDTGTEDDTKHEQDLKKFLQGVVLEERQQRDMYGIHDFINSSPPVARAGYLVKPPKGYFVRENFSTEDSMMEKVTCVRGDDVHERKDMSLPSKIACSPHEDSGLEIKISIASNQNAVSPHLAINKEGSGSNNPPKRKCRKGNVWAGVRGHSPIASKELRFKGFKSSPHSVVRSERKLSQVTSRNRKRKTSGSRGYEQTYKSGRFKGKVGKNRLASKQMEDDNILPRKYRQKVLSPNHSNVVHPVGSMPFFKDSVLYYYEPQDQTSDQKSKTKKHSTKKKSGQKCDSRNSSPRSSQIKSGMPSLAPGNLHLNVNTNANTSGINETGQVKTKGHVTPPSPTSTVSGDAFYSTHTDAPSEVNGSTSDESGQYVTCIENSGAAFDLRQLDLSAGNVPTMQFVPSGEPWTEGKPPTSPVRTISAAKDNHGKLDKVVDLLIQNAIHEEAAKLTQSSLYKNKTDVGENAELTGRKIESMTQKFQSESKLRTQDSDCRNKLSKHFGSGPLVSSKKKELEKITSSPIIPVGVKHTASKKVLGSETQREKSHDEELPQTGNYTTTINPSHCSAKATVAVKIHSTTSEQKGKQKERARTLESSATSIVRKSNSVSSSYDGNGFRGNKTTKKKKMALAVKRSCTLSPLPHHKRKQRESSFTRQSLRRIKSGEPSGLQSKRNSGLKSQKKKKQKKVRIVVDGTGNPQSEDMGTVVSKDNGTIAADDCVLKNEENTVDEAPLVVAGGGERRAEVLPIKEERTQENETEILKEECGFVVMDDEIHGPFSEPDSPVNSPLDQLDVRQIKKTSKSAKKKNIDSVKQGLDNSFASQKTEAKPNVPYLLKKKRLQRKKIRVSPQRGEMKLSQTESDHSKERKQLPEKDNETHKKPPLLTTKHLKCRAPRSPKGSKGNKQHFKRTVSPKMTSQPSTGDLQEGSSVDAPDLKSASKKDFAPWVTTTGPTVNTKEDTPDNKTAQRVKLARDNFSKLCLMSMKKVHSIPDRASRSPQKEGTNGLMDQASPVASRSTDLDLASGLPRRCSPLRGAAFGRMTRRETRIIGPAKTRVKSASDEICQKVNNPSEGRGTATFTYADPQEMSFLNLGLSWVVNHLLRRVTLFGSENDSNNTQPPQPQPTGESQVVHTSGKQQSLSQT